MSARTASLIPFRVKFTIGVIVLAAAWFAWDGGKEPDYKDRDRFRWAAYQVDWVRWGATTPKIIFNYRIGSNVGNDSSKLPPFSVGGHVQQGHTFTIYTQVQNVSEQQVSSFTCQAYLEGNPVRSEIQMEPGKWMRCTAVATW